jgi:hypothetical protein
MPTPLPLLILSLMTAATLVVTPACRQVLVDGGKAGIEQHPGGAAGGLQDGSPGAQGKEAAEEDQAAEQHRPYHGRRELHLSNRCGHDRCSDLPVDLQK